VLKVMLAGVSISLGTSLFPLSPMVELLTFLLIGLIAGWLAGQIMRGGGYGLVGDIVVGIVGSLIGGFLFRLFGISVFGSLGAIVMAVIGAMLLIAVLRTLKHA
jgi:uncharacterized membrane protein YeaQ/YmgE (transglycosylase-associated protein family)